MLTVLKLLCDLQDQIRPGSEIPKKLYSDLNSFESTTRPLQLMLFYGLMTSNVWTKTCPFSDTTNMTCVQGITKTAISKMGMKASDTAILTFEEVRVPLANIVGEEGQGFTYQMLQFQVINISLSDWHCVTTAL